MARKRDPKTGDLVEIQWVDVYEDPVGSPAEALPCLRISYGIYFAKREMEVGGWKLPFIITTTTLDETGPQQSGYCIYPEGVVLDVKVVRKCRIGAGKTQGAST